MSGILQSDTFSREALGELLEEYHKLAKWYRVQLCARARESGEMVGLQLLGNR